MQRFLREARAASRLRHPSIVYISDFGQAEDGSFYLVMEYIPGESLRQELRRGGPLDLQRAVRILTQTAEALDHAHRNGVVHRDLKPDNLMLTEHGGETDFVKVLDFGVAKMLSPETTGGITLTARGEVIGTPEYMAPEQFYGKTVGHQGDIYSLGIVAFELVAGVPPFRGELMQLVVLHPQTPPPSPSSLRPEADIPPEFDAIVARCLKKNPEDRYENALAVAEDLRALMHSSSRREMPAPPSDALWHGTPVSRHGQQKRTFAGNLGLIGTREDLLDSQGVSYGLHSEVLQRTVRDLAEGLRERGLGSPETTVELTRLLQTEERIFAEEAEVALIEAQISDTEQTFEQSASRLRYAAIQLSRERVLLAGGAERPGSDADSNAESARTLPRPGRAGADLERRLAELEIRMASLERDRRERLAAFSSRLDGHQRTVKLLQEQLGRETQRLLELVLEARPSVTEENLLLLYGRLDEVTRRPGSTLPGY